MFISGQLFHVRNHSNISKSCVFIVVLRIISVNCRLVRY